MKPNDKISARTLKHTEANVYCSQIDVNRDLIFRMLHKIDDFTVIYLTPDNSKLEALRGNIGSLPISYSAFSLNVPRLHLMTSQMSSL